MDGDLLLRILLVLVLLLGLAGVFDDDMDVFDELDFSFELKSCGCCLLMI